MPSPTDNTFEGYMFYRADSLLRSKPDWRFVERIPLQIKQRKLGKMVYDRAALYSPVKQQQDLNGYRLRHINRLVADRREVCPDLVWTVAYFKESACAHGRREVMAPDYQQEHDIVSMVVILLARPQQEGKYAKGLIGDLVDIVRAGNDSGHSIDHSSASSVVSEFGGTQDTHCVSTWLGGPKSERSDPGELSLTER